MSIPIITLFFIGILTSAISGAVGMAGGVLLLSAMTFFIPVATIVPIHGVVQLVSNSSRFVLLRKHLRRKIIWAFSLGLPIGAIPSALIISNIEHKHFFFLGISIIIFLSLFKPKDLRFHIKEQYFFFIGIAVGFLGLFVGATGPFIAPFFLNNNFSKKEIVANKACIQTLGHLIKIPAFMSLNFNYGPHMSLMCLLSLGAIGGTFLGVSILKKINENIFRKIFRVALLFAAFRLLFKFFEAIF